MLKSEGDLKNPYTREILSKKIIKNIRHFINLSHVLKEPISIKLDTNQDKLSHKKRISQKALSVFYRIDTFGHVTDTAWFLSLGRMGLIRLVREIRDIFEYRANLSNLVKRQICPPNGNPFHGINIATLVQKNRKILQIIILNIMENLISRGINSDSKALGALYVLAALTLVSHGAATALPWLHQSVNQN